MKNYTIEEAQKYIRKNGTPDVITVEGVLFTMDSYDESGEKITYGNRTKSKVLEVDTENRYGEKKFVDAEICIFPMNGYREDIHYADMELDQDQIFNENLEQNITLFLDARNEIYLNLIGNGGGAISSTMTLKDTEENKEYNICIDAIESMILAQAIEGVNILSGAYKRGILVAVESCDNHF